VSSGNDSDSGEGSKAGYDGTSSNEGGSRSSGGDGCCMCGGTSVSSSASVDDSTNDELRLAREATREEATQWATAHPHVHGGDSLVRRRHADDAPCGGARGCNLDRHRRTDVTLGGPPPRRQARQARMCQRCSRRWWLGRRRSQPLYLVRLSHLGSIPQSPRGPGRCQGHRSRGWMAYPHQDYVEWAAVMRV
jgi:hypothetical protein